MTHRTAFIAGAMPSLAVPALALPALALPALLLLLAPAPAHAQERLVGSRSVAIGASFERLSFGDAGLSQAAFAGLDTTRVRQADQLTIPISASSPLGGSWRLDLTTLYGSGRVGYNRQGAGAGTGTATLSGLSDVRIRATGRLLRDNVVLTLGVNAPSGRTSLDAFQFSALRVLAAPAIGLGSAPVGAGLSGTVGIVFAQQIGAWAVAYGSSYEARGRYQPVAALTAGTGSADFLPGGVLRASLGGDRLLGPHRLSVAAGLDVFADDRLRGPDFGDSAAQGDVSAETRVRLGPVVSGEVQLQLATTRLRELQTFAAYRWRAPFARNGRTVEQSSGSYVDAGVRAVVPWQTGRDLVLSSDLRWHSGLGVDQGLPTAGVTSGTVTAGVQFTRGLLAVQPYVRGQVGSLRQRSPIAATVTQSFFGAGGGLVVVTRF